MQMGLRTSLPIQVLQISVVDPKRSLFQLHLVILDVNRAISVHRKRGGMER